MTEAFESAVELIPPLSKAVGVSKETGDTESESFAQQTDKITQERSIGSGKIRVGLPHDTKDVSVPTSESNYYELV